eukprot:13205710-Ditylum_brightwellii.AAC.1
MAMSRWSGYLRYGSPCVVHLTRSLIVRISRSASSTCSSTGMISTLIGPMQCWMHLNSWSAMMSVMVKPLLEYMFVTW